MDLFLFNLLCFKDTHISYNIYYIKCIIYVMFKYNTELIICDKLLVFILVLHTTMIVIKYIQQH